MQSTHAVTTKNTMTTLTIKECLGFGWRTFRARPWFFVQVGVALLIVSILSGVVQSFITQLLGTHTGGFISFVIAMVIDTFVAMGILAVYLKAHDSVMSPSLQELWNPDPFWKFLGATLVLCIILMVGYVLFIVPGLILTTMLYFTTTLVIDKNLGAIDALKESARMTKGHRWQILFLILAIIGINLLGVAALVVGLFVSVPVSILAMIHAYRHLAGGTAQSADPGVAEVV